MNLLDIRTVFYSYAISNLICLIVIAILWHQNRSRFTGLGFWLVNFILQFLALALLSLRGAAPDVLSITGSNAMILGGTLLLYMGLARFTGKPSVQIPNVLLLAVIILAHAYFATLHPNMAVRNILFALALFILCAQCAWLMLRRVDPEIHGITRWVGYVFVAFCTASIANIVAELVLPAGNDLFRVDVYETLLLLVFQMLSVLETFSLLLMVNSRLIANLRHDINERTLAEKALRVSEEKFIKAFQSSPDAILITRLRDSHFIEVNEGFCRLSGFSRQELLDSSAVNLDLWVDAQERARFVESIRANARARDLEIEFRTRSGKIRKALFSGEIIEIGGEECILSIIQDITERKLTETIIQLRLALWEYSTAHTAQEVMQKALDEIETLTSSLIGFYHGVEAEQGTLTLLAWSTRTKDVFCKAEGEGMHYPIEQAGVWVDCVTQKRPVIHNDYASLPHRKGLPAGHAEVIRELVVPTMRDGQVVAILGVGNKPEDYDEQDVELVSYIADVVWTIVVQKRANEKIQQLNTRLERLAMTDELTGLVNRRSFFYQGNAEIKRVQRYHTPLSMLMLDLDDFKSINDSYGHAAGDAVLLCVANALRANAREVDIVARLGGEEFAILSPNTQAADAGFLAERVRQAIEAIRCSIEDQCLGVTASIGVAPYHPDMQNLDALLRSADAAMYQAKNQGRNQVVLVD